MTVNRNVAHHDQLVVMLGTILESLHDVRWVLFVARGPMRPGVDNPCRRLDKTVAIRVFPDADQKPPPVLLSKFFSHRSFSLRSLDTAVEHVIIELSNLIDIVTEFHT